MKIANYDFVHVGEIEPQRSEDGAVRTLLPQSRYKNTDGLRLHNYGHGPFCKFKVASRIKGRGVYAIVVGGELRYIGLSGNLSSRFSGNGYGHVAPRMCFVGGPETTCRLNNLIYQAATSGNRISLWFHETADYVSTEAALRSSEKPPWNRA